MPEDVPEMEEAFEDAMVTVEATVELVSPYLAGLGPAVQSMILAELMRLYLAGFLVREQRDYMRRMLFDLVTDFFETEDRLEDRDQEDRSQEEK